MPTAFVTGGSGFVGGGLVRRLGADGVGVRALPRGDTSGREVTIDTTRARTELGYAPARTVDEGLAQLADEARRGEEP